MIASSGVASTRVRRAECPLLQNKIGRRLAKWWEGEIGKKWAKVGKKERGLGRKEKNLDDSFTLPLLSSRAGYAI